MDQNRVRELFLLLPSGSAYPATQRRSPFGPPRQEPAERFALALHDPAFAWSFVEAHLKTGKWLPDTICEWPMIQAFAAGFFRVSEPLIMEVASLRSPARWQERDWLDALLLTADSTTADIATLLRLSAEVVEAYTTLFWNVRDRRDEPAYMAQLLYPEGRPAAARNARPDTIGDRLRLLRAGVEGGRAAVLALAGLTPHAAGAIDDSPGRFEQELQVDASRRWAAGARLEDPVIKARHQTALRRQENASDDDPLALHHMNAVSPALEEIRKYNCINSPPWPERDFEKDRAEIMAMLRTGAVKPRE